MYKFEFFVPVDYSEEVKNAVFAAGGGKIGNYDCCSWETEGRGQFRPCEGSTPFIGNAGKVEKMPELKVEMVCDDALIKDVITALKESHPYETPAYQCWKLDFHDL